MLPQFLLRVRARDHQHRGGLHRDHQRLQGHPDARRHLDLQIRRHQDGHQEHPFAVGRAGAVRVRVGASDHLRAEAHRA